MNDSDYLWSGQGEPDLEVQRLENLLGEFRHRPRRSRWRPIAGAIAAALLLTIGVTAYQYTRPVWPVAGLPAQAQLRQGRWLETDSTSHARLDVESIGQIEVDPDSRVRLVRSRPGEHRLALERGRIHAFIWAPPGDFAVETPSALTVDLGCAYDLTVQPNGDGLVEVLTGWVAFEGAGKLSFIPAGAACTTRPRLGPGTPFYTDATAAFRKAVTAFDASDRSSAELLREARPQDALTLWHVLRRVPAGERGPVFDRLAELLSVPPGVTRDGILAGDPHMLAALWSSLGLGEQQWWERWKQKLPLAR